MTAVAAPDPGPDAGAAWHYGDPLGEQRWAATDAVVVDRSHRAVLTLTGPDRLSWLNTISTQQVSAQPDGTSTENLSLDGQGRVEDHWIQTELGGATHLDTEPWRGGPLLDLPAQDGVLGAGDDRPERPRGAFADRSEAGRPGGGRSHSASTHCLPTWPPCHWPTVASSAGCRAPPRASSNSISSFPAAPWTWHRRLTAAGIRPAGVWTYEAHRVAALRPRLGVDTDERTIPHEVGWIGGAVHLDKGCYRGQETVARVHNLGRPPEDARAVAPRRLRGPPGDRRPGARGRSRHRSDRHGGRPCRPWPDRACAAQTWPARRHGAAHRRYQPGERGDRRRLDATGRCRGRWTSGSRPVPRHQTTTKR